MNPKELKKLAAACRAAGILSFKNSEVEFTLNPEQPAKATSKRSKQLDTGPETDFESDTPTGDALLFWSSQGLDSEPTGETQ